MLNNPIGGNKTSIKYLMHRILDSSDFNIDAFYSMKVSEIDEKKSKYDRDRKLIKHSYSIVVTWGYDRYYSGCLANCYSCFFGRHCCYYPIE
jgi:hypothetical protein